MASLQKTILVADDDIEDLELLQEVLLQIEPDLEIVLLTRGVPVIEHLEQQNVEPPSLIVLDYNMPDLNGAQLVRRLCTDSRWNGIPKIVWSTSNSEGYRKECMDNGASAYFVKPSTHLQLEELARQLITFFEA